MNRILDSIIVCPETLNELTRTPDGYINQEKGFTYSIYKGIPVLRSGKVLDGTSLWSEDTEKPEGYAYALFADNLQMPSPVLRALGKIIEKIVATVANRPGLMLDLDTGTGMLTTALCSSGALSSVLIASDHSPHILLGLADLLKNNGCHPPVSIAMNPQQLPIKSSVVDTIVTLSAFNNLKNSKLALTEAARVLKPGGMLMFSHLLLPDPSSKGYQRAEKRDLSDLLDISSLDLALRTHGMRIASLEEYAHGTWQEHPDNFIPASNDPYSLVLIKALMEGSFE